MNPADCPTPSALGELTKELAASALLAEKILAAAGHLIAAGEILKSVAAEFAEQSATNAEQLLESDSRLESVA